MYTDFPSHKCAGLISPNSNIVTAAYLGRLETDDLLKKNMGVFRRDSFEPLKEKEVAVYRDMVQNRLVGALFHYICELYY
jgi:hypothetical protein